MTEMNEQPKPKPDPQRIWLSGPHYLITETDERFWWLEQRPVYVTPAHWWDR
jgi:hypothetical protein